ALPPKRHALDLPVHRRRPRDRLGRRPEIHGGFHPPLAVRRRRHRDGCQHVPPRARRAGLPIGTAYAVWTGIGAAGTALLGIVLFHESASALRLICVALILTGVVGLKLLGK